MILVGVDDSPAAAVAVRWAARASHAPCPVVIVRG